MNNNKSNVITLGCRLNIYESEVIKSIIKRNNINDYTIINSCVVTNDAEKKVDYEIRKAKRLDPSKKIILTGCAAQINPEKYSKMSEVFLVLGNNKKMEENVWKNIQKYNNVLVDDILKVSHIENGKTLDEEGEQLGNNEGYINYTIGQRRGIGLSNPNPLYVKEINPKNNTIVVGEKNSLFKNICKVKHLNWLIDKPKLPHKTLCQIRYNGNKSEGIITEDGSDFVVKFKEPQLAITPGQSIVFYSNDILSGGGIIKLYD